MLKDAATTLVERKTLRESVRCRGAGCAPNGAAGDRASLCERPRCRFLGCLNRLPFAMHPCHMAIMTSSGVEEASALIASVAAGDEIAFASIVRLHHEDMRRVCIVVAGDDGIAEDAVAAAWSIAWRKLGSLRDPARLRPWLVSVAVNEARQLLRARKRRSLLEVPVVQVDEPGVASTRGQRSTPSTSATHSSGSTRMIEPFSRCDTWLASTRPRSPLRQGEALRAHARAWRASSSDSKGSSAMNELSMFERRLAAGLEAVAGPRRDVDAIAIARTAASRAATGRSIMSRVSALIGQGARVRGRRPGDLGASRRARALLVFVLIALITVLAIGAIAVGSGLVRLTAVVPPSPTHSPTFTPVPTTAQQRPAAWTSVGDVPSLLGPTPLAVRLHDGRVLLMKRISCGGCNDAGGAMYDPTTRSWSSASRIPTGGSATLLGDGTVLVAGGGKSGTASQLYDPVSGQWVATGSMTIARSGPETSAANTAGYTATLLLDGRVLVAGGATAAVPGGLLVDAEIYDPVAGRWSATGSMVHARANHTATLLPDGRVLVAGGSNPRRVSGPAGPSATTFDSAEIYDPQTGTWTGTESMPEPRAFQTATLLPDGTVLVAGGGSDEYVATLSTTAAYDPRTGRWMSTGNLSMARVGCTATVLPDGSVLIAGGYLAVKPVPSDLHSGDPHSTAIAERYDPTAGSWTLTASMTGPRALHSAVLPADGSVLVAGGEPSLTLWDSSGELYDPGSGN
jgi:hypothetical protein